MLDVTGGWLAVARPRREVDGRLVVEERLTQQDIGERVGASREMVRRILKDLTAGGISETTAARSSRRPAARLVARPGVARRRSAAPAHSQGEPSPRAPWRNEGRCRGSLRRACWSRARGQSRSNSAAPPASPDTAPRVCTTTPSRILRPVPPNAGARMKRCRGKRCGDWL